MPHLLIYPTSVAESTWSNVGNLVGNTETDAYSSSATGIGGTVAVFEALFDFSGLPANAYITGITGGIMARSNYYSNSRETYALTLERPDATGVISESRQQLSTATETYLLPLDLELARTRGYTDERLRVGSKWTFTLLSKIVYTEITYARKLWLDVEYEISTGSALFFGEPF